MTIKKSTIVTIVIFAFAISSSLAMVPTAKAQDIPHVIMSTIPMDSTIKDRVDSWLQTSPPTNEIYYAVTYVQLHGFADYYVSLVALHLESPGDPWSFTGDEETGESKVVWFGTILLKEDGTVEIFSTSTTSQSSTQSNFKFARPALPAFSNGAGGGFYVRFPFQPANAVKYGINGIHAPGYGLSSGWRAVDLVSGSDMGTGAANDQVYNSVAGSIDYVCQDSDSTAVKISGSGDQFLYAHLVHNSNLEIGHTFPAGGVIGGLVHGSFAGDLVGNCGYAVQTDQHWHLHWGFIMANSRMQVEGCTLYEKNYMSDDNVQIGTAGEWKCGNETIKAGWMLHHFGDIPGNDTSGTDRPMAFWDYIIAGINSVFNELFRGILPEKSTLFARLIDPLMTAVKLVFRVAYILMKGNFNVAPAVLLILATISFRVACGGIIILAAIFRIVKMIPVIG